MRHARSQRPYESEHTDDPGSGILRAGVFGVSDGLVSNIGLVMGVAGGTGSRTAILLAGIAGLIAGAFSMAAGEYISMRTQREVLERELRVESEHIRKYPEEERLHLAELLVENGLDSDIADRVSREVHSKTDSAVDFHARFELGIIPEELGSPIGAAVSSFLLFAVGAVIPLIPFFFTGGGTALAVSIVVSAIALILVGGALTRFTGQNIIYGGARQLGVGVVAAGVTFAIGSAFGAAIGT